MNLPHLTEQWQTLHDACLAEAKTLVDVPGREEAILSLSKTAAVCVDVLQNLNHVTQPITGLRDMVYGIPNRSDLP